MPWNSLLSSFFFSWREQSSLTALFSQSHRMTMAVHIHHSTSLISNLLISRKVTMLTWNNRPEEKCMDCLTGFLCVTKATGSNWTFTPDGTQMYLPQLERQLAPGGKVASDENGMVLSGCKEYTLQNVDSLFPSYPSKSHLLIN